MRQPSKDRWELGMLLGAQTGEDQVDMQVPSACRRGGTVAFTLRIWATGHYGLSCCNKTGTLFIILIIAVDSDNGA